MVSRTFDTAYIRKYKHCTLCLATQSCSTLCDPVDCSPPCASVHGDSLGKNTGVGSLSLLQGIFLTRGSDPGLPPCRRILYHQPPGKPKNNGVSSLSHLQRISLTQEWNLDLLHCRWILLSAELPGKPTALLLSIYQSLFTGSF